MKSTLLKSTIIIPEVNQMLTPGEFSLMTQWLYDKPEPEVYKLLIDCYRLRIDDEYVFRGDVDEDGLYGGASSGLPGF